MRVAIEHVQEKRGVFKKVTHYKVDVKVTFSEEEMAIIKNMGLEDYRVILRGPTTLLSPPEPSELTIGDLVKDNGNWQAYATKGEAVQYEAAITERIKEMKVFIMQHGGADTGKKTFEL